MDIFSKSLVIYTGATNNMNRPVMPIFRPLKQGSIRHIYIGIWPYPMKGWMKTNKQKYISKRRWLVTLMTLLR